VSLPRSSPLSSVQPAGASSAAATTSHRIT
jgi:hypothetical protein